MNRKILIVDDEISILESLGLILKHAKYEVDTCIDGFSALEKISKSNYDLILLDIKMPQMDGLEVLERIKISHPEQVVIMISGHGNIETAVEATKKGAYYFLEKPLPDIPELLLTIHNAIEYKISKEELINLKRELIQSNEIVGQSPGIQNVIELIEKLKNINLNVLITGESGTGKSLVAKQIHYKSDRSDKPFIVINCATLKEENALEELFGHYEKGNVRIQGKFSEAEGGTILFDEITNLSADIQSIMLKVIDEGKFNRIGQNEEIKTDVRFLFTTNKDIQAEILEGRFREDLFHRINVMNINVPSLRERISDISVLVDYFVEQICRIYNLSDKKFTPEALERMKLFRWPGNVRELKNIIERLLITADKNEVNAEDIEIPDTKHSKELNDLLNKNLSLNDFQNDSERIFILKMLGDYKYNISQTAEAMKIQRSHLYKLLSKYNIPTPTKVR
ncbi:MAG: sigma-54 dependent transcriptional regulator [Ignavibacteria bacterium]|jgi:two-component system nitrogen regulation response regulator NtrX|nr:sigma-54 dependent transcriptional regulator [Ignavibacteria bacterium]